MNATPSGRVSGKTLKFTWTDGPTKGEAHEHRFHEDGSVEFRKVLAHGDPRQDHSGAGFQREQRYAAASVSDDVDIVSYLASNGYTLTVALNHRNKSIIGFASNDKQWFPLRGTFS